MKILKLVQGSPEWHAHRAAHLNASDAPAMLGQSSYKSRGDLLRERATGITPEVDTETQRRFDSGHRFEALARPLAESIIGEDLYPCVGVHDDDVYSASFDGLTLLGDVAFEHKRLNETLREAMFEGCTGADLPIEYRIQMEHQVLVSGTEKILFMASDWDANDQLVEERHCWYTPDPSLRGKVVAGWFQFERDRADYKPEAAPPPALIGRAPDQLPALRIELTGMVTESNLHEFKARAIAVFKGISTDLQTDQDFADAEQTVKFCEDVEKRLKGAKEHALSQTQSIDQLFKALDDIAGEARAKRLQLEKLVAARKESIRGEIVAGGRADVVAHYQGINASLGQHAIAIPGNLTADLNAAIKGKRTIASLKEAVSTVVTTAKIEASQQADRVRANISLLEQQATGHAELFPDRVTLCATKSPEDLQNLIAARVAEKEAQLERERERIRQEEAAKTSMPAVAEKPCDSNTGETTTIRPGANERADVSPAVAGASQATIKLGDFNQLIAPLSISAEGLAQFGCKPLAQPRNAKVYRIADLTTVCTRLYDILASAPQRALEQASQKKAA